MKRIATVLTLALVPCLATPARAWNGFGHMTVAALAYEKLTPSTKEKVAALLKINPDYGQWVAGVPAADRDRVAFVMAANWADTIKSKPGYQNDVRPSQSSEGSRNIGYADKRQHKYWHYINLPFSPDGTALKHPEAPNAKTQIAAFRTVLRTASASDDQKSYALVWLLHLVGDAHQPLHATSRFDRDQPNGDRGGNLVALCQAPCRDELHAFWDGVLGSQTAPEAAIATAATLPAIPAALATVDDEARWIEESFLTAQRSVYSVPVGVGAGPFTLDPAYRTAAKRVAMERVALAGARLANILNEDLVWAGSVEQEELPPPTSVETTDKIVVFNTKTLKYHDPSCRSAAQCTRNCIKIPLPEARRRGGVSCKACGR